MVSNSSITTYIAGSENDTLKIAADFADTLVGDDVVALIGDLGAGKTVFARGVARAFGITESVTSPTFTLIHEYSGKHHLYHMDLYRMKSVDEIIGIGVEDYLYSGGVCLIEWAEKLGSLYPEDVITVTINHLKNSSREIIIERNDAR